MTELVEYLDEDEESPFGDWFEDLNIPAAARVTTALARMGLGNLSNAKSVGSGVYEFRINFGPGYRVYFGQDGDELIILLGGGSKKRQSDDIAAAKQHWRDYKVRKREQEEGR